MEKNECAYEGEWFTQETGRNRLPLISETWAAGIDGIKQKSDLARSWRNKLGLPQTGLAIDVKECEFPYECHGETQKTLSKGVIRFILHLLKYLFSAWKYSKGERGDTVLFY